MAYPNRGLQKAAMGHYLTESARAALEALEPEEDVVKLGPLKQMPAVGPNQLLDMPLFSKTPFFPGSDTLFYTTNVGEKLYQPSSTFDLNDPYCKVMAPKYNSLHDPHLRAYYRRKDNLQLLKKSGFVTDNNKVVCSLKEFNEYRQYLTSLKMEFEKHYIREQKMLEKEFTTVQDSELLPEAADTSKYRDWLLKEERITPKEQEDVLRKRYLKMINEELEKLEELAEENQSFVLAQDEKKKQGLEKRKQFLLRKKIEEEWRRKEMILLIKIGDDIKREARIEEQRQKTKEEKLKRKQTMLEKKMAYHLEKLQERFLKEGFPPPDEIFSTQKNSEQVLESTKSVSKHRRHSKDSKSLLLEPAASEIVYRGSDLPDIPEIIPHSSSDKVSCSPTKEVFSLTSINGTNIQATEFVSGEPESSCSIKVVPSASAECVSNEGGVSACESAGCDSKICDGSAECGSNTCGGSAGCGSKSFCCGSAGCGSNSCGGSAGCGSNACGGSAGCGSNACSGSAGCGSNACGGSAGCGSKSFCCGSAGCGSNACGGSAGCGSNTCGGSAGCGSNACGGSAGCGSNTCGGSAGCGSKKDNKSLCSNSARCCCNNGKNASCASGGCRSGNSKAHSNSDSRGSSRHEASNGTSKFSFSSMAGGNPSSRTTTKECTKTIRSSAVSHKTASHGDGKAKQKKREMSVGEQEGQLKERSSSKKQRTEKRKSEHNISTAHDNEGLKSSYSAYIQYVLLNTDQSEIRESLKGKVSASELNSIIQNVMTWVVSAVTTILYPALTKFEERMKTHMYTVAEESVLSSDNSSSCSTCNEELCEIHRILPCSSTRKVSFTDPSIRPTVSLSEFQMRGKHGSLLSSNSVPFTKSTHASQESDHFKRMFKRGKTAILVSPSKYSGLLSTMRSVRSSKSDSHITHLQKYSMYSPEHVNISCHSKHRHAVPAILKITEVPPKEDNTAESEGMPFGGEPKPSHANASQQGDTTLKDLRNIFTDLKSYITKKTAVLLEDIFKRILGDLGFTSSTVSITIDVLLESISESLLGSDPKGTSESGSISGIASFMANDIVENVLHKLQAAAQRSYLDILSKNDLATGCKAKCLVTSEKHTVPDPTFWRARIPLSFESVYGIAEEIVEVITEKLKILAISSQTKLYQFELCARIKAPGIPLEQLFAAIPPQTVESDAANSIVKDTIRKIVSKTIASSETDILQSIEEMISRVLSFIQRQTSHEGLLPTRESSIILQLINDVFNSLSTEKLKGSFPMAQSTAGPETQEGLSQQETAPPVTTATLFTAETGKRKPLPPVNVPGMVIDVDVEGKVSTEPDETLFSTREQKAMVTTATQGKTTYESFNPESRQSSPKLAPGSGEAFLEEGGQMEPAKLEETQNNSAIRVQEATLSSAKGEERVELPDEEMPSLGQPTTVASCTLHEALKEMEDEFQQEEQSLLFETVRKLLDDIFQHVWASWPIWPPASPPPSLVHVNKEQTHFHGQTPILDSDSDVSNLAGELVKTLFQKVSCAALAGAQGPGSHQSSLINTDVLPLEVAADAGKSVPSIHFKDPEVSFEVGTSKEVPHPSSEDLTTILQNLPSKCSLANDLVQTFLVKLESFVTSKAESQFWSDAQNLKTACSSDFPSDVDQDLRRLWETHYGSLPSNLEDILHSFNNPVLEKAKHMLLPSYSDLKTYAQEVAKMILQILKHGLDKEVEKIAVPPIIFSESIAASQIVNMVFAIFSPQEAQTDLPGPVAQEECILEKLLRRNPGYKTKLQTQIQPNVGSVLNEIYQTIMFHMSNFPHSSCGPRKFHTPKTDTYKPAKCDVSVVSEELVDLVLDDLCYALGASMSMKGALQSLVCDLVKKTVQPLAQMSGREARAGFKGHLTDFEKSKPQLPGWSKAENVLGARTKQFETKLLSGLKEVTAEGMAKSFVDNIFFRLASFAEEKLVSEWRDAAQWEKQSVNKGRLAPTHSTGLFPWEPSNTHGPTLQGIRDDEASGHHQKAKLVVRDSQVNLRLCAEKLTGTILQFIQKDLEGEMTSLQNEEKAAHEMVNKILRIVSVQTALTENEVQKRVLKRIFRRHPLGQKLTFPLLETVEYVLEMFIQRKRNALGHFRDSIFLNLESKCSAYQSGSVASEIVDTVLHKMYLVVMDTLFRSSEPKSEMDSLSSGKGSLLTKDSCLTGASDIKKMAPALSNLQTQPQFLAEELVQGALNRLTCFAAENLKDILPLSAQQKWKPHGAFHREMQAGDGSVCRPRTFADDSEGFLMSMGLSKSELTMYAKDIVVRVLGTIRHDFKTEDYHRKTLQIHTLSCGQISIVNDLVGSVIKEIYGHKDLPSKHFKSDGLPSSQKYFNLESAKAKCVFHDEFKSYLKHVLPKGGILKHIFEHQPLTDANTRENLKMLQGVENVVTEVFMRIQDLEASVCLLKRIPGELAEKLFCSNFKRGETLGLSHSSSQEKIGLVAQDIVANVFENVQKCLERTIPSNPQEVLSLGSKTQDNAKGSIRAAGHPFTQPEYPFDSVAMKTSMDTIDRIAKDAIECVVLTLETFVARHFRGEFKCNFLEIVKFPLESLVFTRATQSLHSLSTQAGTSANEIPGTLNRRPLPALRSAHNFLDGSKLGSTITKECIEAAFRQVQRLHSELSVYANNAVSSILEMIKQTLDKQLGQKEASLSNSPESLVLSETVSVMLDCCTESLTEITSELMVENLQLQTLEPTFASNTTDTKNPVALPEKKNISIRDGRIDLGNRCSPINVPGMAIHLEEGEIKEEIPSELSSVLKFPDRDIHTMPEGYKGMPCCLSTSEARATRWHGLDTDANELKSDFLVEDLLPRQRSIPKGSILEKLFNKTEDSEAICRIARQRNKGEVMDCEHLLRSELLGTPEAYPAVCPLKLTQTADRVVNTILSEFGPESEPWLQASCVEKSRLLSPLKKNLPLETSHSPVFGEPQLKKQAILSRWEKRLTDSSEETNTPIEESSLLTRDGSSLLSKWESTQAFSKIPERHKELELLACAHMPKPCEIQKLADHIVLCVIKELIVLTTRDPLEGKDSGTSVQPWKQKLQERICRSVFPLPSQQISSWLDLLWEPLTKAVVSNILSNISNAQPRQSTQDRNDSFESTLSMFCSVDSYCPEHGMTGSRNSPLNIDELVTQISEVIIGVLCERNMLQELPQRRGLPVRKTKYIYVPPLCFADFDDVYHPLVQEVKNLLSEEIERRNKHGAVGNYRDFLAHYHFASPRFTGTSQTDDKGSGDVQETMCLISNKNQRLSCIASNLDHLVHNLETEESKDLVHRVLNIIFDSLRPAWAQRGFAGSFPDPGPHNRMFYEDTKLLAKRHLFCPSVCPHACRLTNDMASSNLGLSPKSFLLLDVVSEKLIRALLEKCLTTDKFVSTFAFDEFPEDEQIHDAGKEKDDDTLSRGGTKAHQVDSNSILTYEIKYSEEPWTEVQAGASSYEAALDTLAYTLVKPVIAELSHNVEQPKRMSTFCQKTVEFRQPICSKPHAQHTKYGRIEAHPSMPRGRKPEYRMSIPGGHHARKNAREKNKPLLESTVQHGAFGFRAAAPTGRGRSRKPFSASCVKKFPRRDMSYGRSHPAHSQFQPECATVYSAKFLEEVICQLLVRLYSSLCTKYDSICCIDMQQMNVLFVNALVEEFKKAGVRLLQKTEEKAHCPPVDSQTINKLVDSILREFVFQLAADKSIVRDISTMAEWAAEIILVEILDYQLPPSVCRKLPKSVYKNVKARSIIHRTEECFTFPRARRQNQPPSTYVTIVSQKFLERVLNRLVAQFFPSSDSATQKQDKKERSQVDFDDLSSCMIDQVMKSIAKHKIWVAKKDDQCHLLSEKDVQKMVDSVYTKILTKSGSQFSIQKDVKCRNTSLVDSITSFIIQEISHHHLQTFLPTDEGPYSGPDTKALSKNIVKTVLDSVSKTPAAPTGVFPVKELEETVTRVLSKIFHGSMAKMEVTKGRHEADLHETAKRLAKSIHLQFGRAPVMGAQKREDQSLVHPLMDVMDDMVESVCHNISTQQELVPCDVHGPRKDDSAFETIKNSIQKGISDYLLHPLFSGDFLKGPSSSPHYKGNTGITRDGFEEIQEEHRSRSAFNTFLSSGFLKDILNGLLLKIFPPTSSGDNITPHNEICPSDSDISKLSTQLLDDVRMNLLKHEIKVMKDTQLEQPEFSEEDVQSMTDSLSRKILQKAGSLEAIQRDMIKKNNSLTDQIAGFLIGDILKQHVQPFVSQQAFPAWDMATVGDSMSALDILRMMIKPLDLRQPNQEMKGDFSPSVLGEIISGVFSKMTGALSDIPLTDSAGDLRDTAAKLAESVTQKLTKAQFNINENSEEQLGFAPEVRTLIDQASPYKDRLGLPCDENRGHTSPHHMTTMSFDNAADQLGTEWLSNLAEVKCFIQKNLFVDETDFKAKSSAPYKTTVSHQVLEAIIDRLLCLIFPSLSSTSVCSTQGGEPYGPDFYNRIAQIKKDIIATVLMQAIWISSYRNDRETNVSEEAMKSMVESVYRDLLHEVLFQQPLPQDRESLSNFYVTKIVCFVMNEMFKYHLQSLATGEASSGKGHHLTILPCSLLEVMLSQLLEKIFSSPEGRDHQIDFSDSNFTEMAANLKSRVITDISAHEIRLVNAPERIPDMDRESEEDIANAIYHQIVCNPESHSEVQNSLLSRRDAVILQVAGVLIREILNYHLCPFLTGRDSSKSNCAKWQEEMEPRPHDVHSAVLLEDVVVAFFRQILSSPNFQAYTEENHLTEDQMRDRVIRQANALVLAFNLSNIKVIHCTEEYSYFPQVAAEEVIQISNTIYQKLIEKSGSELEIFKAFQNKSPGLAGQLIPLLIKEVSGYKFQPLLTGDTSTYLFSFLQADAIIDRLETILPDSTSSSTSFGEKFLKIIHRVFPLWPSSDGPEEHDPTFCTLMKKTSVSKHMKKDQVSNSLQTGNRVDVHPSDSLKDTFHGLISKLLITTTNAGADPEPLLRNFVGSILKEFAKSPVKVLQVPGKGHESPAVSGKEVTENMWVWEHDDKAEELYSGDGQALGTMVNTVCTSIVKYASSESSLYDDLASHNEEAVDKLACYMMRTVSASDLEPGTDSEDDLPYSNSAIRLECDKIIQKFLNDLKLGERKSESSETQASMVSVLFLEEILSRFLTKILLEQCDLALPQQKTLSKAEVNDIAHQLKTSVEMQMSKNKITLIPEDQPNLHPDDEDKVNQVVHSVVNNVLEKSGSQKEMYKDIRETKVIFPEAVASIIIGEISSCSTTNPFSENTENETRSALELDRIVSKVVAQMSDHVDLDKEPPSDIMTALPDTTEKAVEEAFSSKELPIRIVPCLGDKPFDIDPNLVSDHLAVLSVKTEPLEKMNKRCRSRTGVSLHELRKASMSTKSIIKNIRHENENKKKKEKHPSLDSTGRLDFRPREVVCRNSFRSLVSPNIATVELLKDVTNTEDLMVRLVVHDIEGQPFNLPDSVFKEELGGEEEEEEEEEKVLKAETSMFFVAHPVPPEKDKGATVVAPKEAAAVGSTSSTEASKSTAVKKGKSTDVKESKSKDVKESKSTDVKESKSTHVPPAQSVEGKPEEETLEQAVVDVHLSRDTEETPAVFEVIDLDKNEHEHLSEEEEGGQGEARTKPLSTSTSKTGGIPRQQSSRFEKLSNALSRVFSRTSATALNDSAAAQEETIEGGN